MCDVSAKDERKNENDTKTFTYDEAMELTGHGSYNYLLLITCSIISNAVALDMFGYSIVVAAAKCDLRLGVTETGILASAPFIGVLFAHPWGYFADTRGRKRAIMWSTIVGFIFATASSFSPNWPFMMVVKVIGCSFSNASFSLTMTLLGECTGISKRSTFLFMMMSFNLLSECISFGLAYLVLPLQFSIRLSFLGFDFNSWRLFTLLLALPLGIGGLLLSFLYESPKYLASRGDNKKALEVLKKIYKWNGGNEDEYAVEHMLTDDAINGKRSFWQSLVEQTVPIFKPPLLWRTLQIFYLFAICSSTNNAFLMWYPTIVNLFFNSLSSTELNNGKTFCERLFSENVTVVLDKVTDIENDVCDSTISPLTSISGMFYGTFFCIMTLSVSRISARKHLIIFWLLVSSISCALVDLKQMAASLVFFMLLQSTTIGLPSLAGYCVDLYPTAYRGLVTSLGMMTARTFSLVGVNFVGATITTNCSLTFYSWSALVFSGVIVSMFFTVG